MRRRYGLLGRLLFTGSLVLYVVTSHMVGMVFLDGCFSQGGGCAQELPGMEPSRAAPGETFRLFGGDGGFGAPCNDSPGAFGSGSPERNIRIELRQGDSVWQLDTVDALQDYTIDAELTVPDADEPGPATVEIQSEDSLEPLELPFRVTGQGTTS